MLIIPAIDIYEGKCVRLRQGDYGRKTVYSASPAEVAKQFADSGLNFLHVVDLEGAERKKIVNMTSIESIASVKGIKIEVGGGIRTAEDIRSLISAGAERVVVGSVAVKSPRTVESWIGIFSAGKIAVGMDVKEGSVAISGWLEKSRIKPKNFISDLACIGSRIFICTDISRDGMLEGTNMDFFRDIRTSFPDLSIIASGGISSAEDIKGLESIGLSGVIVGKAIYENRISLDELAKLNGESC
jgi:phosphoribosylformimino-5-aminoimidazole carboxamide ribotide isomerase